jgi:hypothetical protein
MYSLEYKLMVQVLRQLKSSGEFHADVSSQAALRRGGQVVLQVSGGNVISCLILNRSGQTLYHDADAQRLLLKLGVLDWKLVTSTAAKTSHAVAPPTKPAEGNGHFYPRRLTVPEAQMCTWSALERSVYSLADGRRSIEQIASFLSRPLPVIEQVIYDFQVSGVIV